MKTWAFANGNETMLTALERVRWRTSHAHWLSARRIGGTVQWEAHAVAATWLPWWWSCRRCAWLWIVA